MMIFEVSLFTVIFKQFLISKVVKTFFHCIVNNINSSSVYYNTIFFITDMFITLIKKAEAFFEKFSLKKLKLGSIIEYLDRLGMTETKEKLAIVLKTIRVFQISKRKNLLLLSLINLFFVLEIKIHSESIVKCSKQFLKTWYQAVFKSELNEIKIGWLVTMW